MVAAASTAPVAGIVAVTPNDSTDIAATRGLLIDGTAGAVKITTAGGDTVTLNNLAVGVDYPFQVTRVWSTGTAATSIYALY